MEITFERGIILKKDNYRIMLDPEKRRTPVNVHTLVSHAHTDHTQAVASHSPTHINTISLDLYKATQDAPARDIRIQNNYEPFEIGPFEIEFLNAGHLLGAVQMVVRSGDESFLYTGDYCPEDLLTVKGADIAKEIDIMAVDATYGDSKIHFQPRSSSRTGILSWLVNTIRKNKLPVLNIARLGGSQEIIKFINRMLPNLPIYVHDKISNACEVYISHGQNLEYSSLNQNKHLLDGKGVVLLPRSTKEINDLLPESILGKVSRCIVTGQSARYGFSKFDNAIPLSTHASMREILETVKTLEPSHVLTNFGYSKELADFITNDRSIACEARSLKEIDIVDCKEMKALHYHKANNGDEKRFDDFFD